MTKTNDYYKILGVSKTATADEIRKAYRKLARKYHPDVNKDADAVTKFAEVQEAYDTLSDAEKRKMYDQFGATGPRASGFSGGQQWSQQAGQSGGFQGGNVNFEDIFGSAFGGGGGSPFGGGGGTPSPQKGADNTASVTVTFVTALKGGSEEIQVDGSTASLKIPAGIESGKKLRLKGKGQLGLHGGQAGDLLVTVTVGGHPLYRRDGLDVEMDIPLNIAEAALGTKVSIPLPLGGSVELAIPAGVSSGKRLRVKGQGCNVSDTKVGDFYAVISITAPETLDEEAKTLVEELKTHLQNPRDESTFKDVE